MMLFLGLLQLNWAAAAAIGNLVCDTHTPCSVDADCIDGCDHCEQLVAGASSMQGSPLKFCRAWGCGKAMVPPPCNTSADCVGPRAASCNGTCILGRCGRGEPVPTHTVIVIPTTRPPRDTDDDDNSVSTSGNRTGILLLVGAVGIMFIALGIFTHFSRNRRTGDAAAADDDDDDEGSTGSWRLKHAHVALLIKSRHDALAEDDALADQLVEQERARRGSRTTDELEAHLGDFSRTS